MRAAARAGPAAIAIAIYDPPAADTRAAKGLDAVTSVNK
jgi:hypothetical protein